MQKGEGRVADARRDPKMVVSLSHLMAVSPQLWFPPFNVGQNPFRNEVALQKQTSSQVGGNEPIHDEGSLFQDRFISGSAKTTTTDCPASVKLFQLLCVAWVQLQPLTATKPLLFFVKRGVVD